jgi:DNA primase
MASNRPLEVVLARDGDAAGQRATMQTIEKMYDLKQPPIWTSQPDWAVEAEIEHLDRLLCEAEPRGVAEGILLDERRELLLELDRRRKRTYKAAQSPYDWSSLLDAIKARADLLAVFGSRGVGLESKGWGAERRLQVLCPLHHDTNPSLTIYVDEQRWFCHGCRKGGDVIDAVELLDGLEFVPACLKLAQEFGINVPRRSPMAVQVPQL